MSHPLRTVGLIDEEERVLVATAPAPAEPTPSVPSLRVVLGGRHPAVLRRRRTLLALLVLVALTITGLATRALGSPADEAPVTVAGHETIAPGETLWDVAVANAPAGTDPRAYLEQLRRLNGLDAAPIPAWTVVLLPATG